MFCRVAQFLCVVFLFSGAPAFAAPCDNVPPYQFEARAVCDTMNSEGTCLLTKPVNFLLGTGYYPTADPSCATAVWNFGDGSPAVTANGAVAVRHQYAAAGEYDVRVSITTSAA